MRFKPAATRNATTGMQMCGPRVFWTLEWGSAGLEFEAGRACARTMEG